MITLHMFTQGNCAIVLIICKKPFLISNYIGWIYIGVSGVAQNTSQLLWVVGNNLVTIVHNIKAPRH